MSKRGEIRKRIDHVRRFFRRRDDVKLGDVVGGDSLSDFLEHAKPGQLKWAANRVRGSKLRSRGSDDNGSSSVHIMAGRQKGISVSVEYENEYEHGTVTRISKFKLRGGDSNESYSVAIGANRLGTITTNSKGVGVLRLSTDASQVANRWTHREARSLRLGSRLRVGGNQFVTRLGSNSAYRDVSKSASSSPAETEIHMRGEGGLRGKAEWEVEPEHGTLEKKFEVKIRNAAAGSSYKIFVDNLDIGTISANGRGRGEVEFSTRPDDDEVRLPANFPDITAGTKVRIGSVMSGVFGSSSGGSDDSGSGDEFELKSKLGGASGGGRFGQAKFEQEMEHGSLELKLRVQVKNADANDSLTVKVDGQAVGVVETNGRGRGRLELTNMPNHRREMALPSSFDGLSVGSQITIGNSISGFFVNSPS